MFLLQQSRDWLSRYRKRACLHSTGISLACPAKVKPQTLHDVAKPSAARCATKMRPGTRDSRCKSSVAFCPHCYALITAGDARCPICGADWYAHSYAARLVLAWNHLLADVRMRAIIALGLRRERLAGQPLVEYASYGILRTSSRLGDRQQPALASQACSNERAAVKARSHPGRSVGRAAQRTLRDAPNVARL
jgi:hypothetical protein